jgi:hypothetical protein
MAAGAAAGALGAVALGLLRASTDGRTISRESVELKLNIPVVAELAKSADQRSKAWMYVAAYLARSNVTEPVVVVTGRRPFTVDDLKIVRKSVETVAAGRGPDIRGVAMSIDDPQLPAAVLSAGALMLMVTKGVDDLTALRPIVSDLSKVARGPVFAVLDVVRVARPFSAPSRDGGPPAEHDEQWVWPAPAWQKQELH